MYHARSRRPARPRAAIRVICAGGILGLLTVLASAFNAVSSPQSVALALVSFLTICGGLLCHFAATMLPGLRIAWRRGFQHGLEAGSRAQYVADQSRVLTVVQPDAAPAEPGAETPDSRTRPGPPAGEDPPAGDDPAARDDPAADEDPDLA